MMVCKELIDSVRAIEGADIAITTDPTKFFCRPKDVPAIKKLAEEYGGEFVREREFMGQVTLSYW
jgi:hypothetical protein